MKIVECEQGSYEWIKARLGIPTASNFKKILTEKTLKPSSQSTDYMYRCLAEWHIGQPLEDVSTLMMERGTELEAEARNWYGFQRNIDPVQVGLCTTEDGKIGASPDALVGEEGVLEIKCPQPHTHLRYLRGDIQDYRLQMQGQLYVTGRDWCDFLSYHPSLPNEIVRIEKDHEVQQALDKALTEFCNKLEKEKAWLLKQAEK